MAKKSPIRQFCNNYMPTPRKTTATIALDSRLGLLPSTRMPNKPQPYYVPLLNVIILVDLRPL
ncbi:MAG: hypothetical protein HWQ23_31335 [Nostoc sp. JL33]|uniref:hypothetical protein n=1 Tax=unclassified Nostoc TaxID=2593658 RepID=UPI0025EE0B47|nr:hypothetical protein [Nostoc sp. JL33]MBN3874600.1 hypothetical protein [Nostoc sp. JL33]